MTMGHRRPVDVLLVCSTAEDRRSNRTTQKDRMKLVNSIGKDLQNITDMAVGIPSAAIGAGRYEINFLTSCR